MPGDVFYIDVAYDVAPCHGQSDSSMEPPPVSAMMLAAMMLAAWRCAETRAPSNVGPTPVFAFTTAAMLVASCP